MIDGITILNQTEIMEVPNRVIFFTICISLVVGIVAAVIFDDAGALPIFSLLTLIILIIITSIFFEQPTGRYKYECTIDDSVSMTEVYEKYEVVEQRGDIWVLKDKE